MVTITLKGPQEKRIIAGAHFEGYHASYSSGLPCGFHPGREHDAADIPGQAGMIGKIGMIMAARHQYRGQESGRRRERARPWSSSPWTPRTPPMSIEEKQKAPTHPHKGLHLSTAPRADTTRTDGSGVAVPSAYQPAALSASSGTTLQRRLNISLMADSTSPARASTREPIHHT